MHRQIILDTETTGLDATRNHKIIEIGCIEIIDRKYTGKDFHFYLNPKRKIDQGAINIHGITNEFLEDKPLFADIKDDLFEFAAPYEQSCLTLLNQYLSLIHISEPTRP